MLNWDKTLAEKWLGELPDSSYGGKKRATDNLSKKAIKARFDFLNRLNKALEENRNNDQMIKLSGILRVDIIDGKTIGFEGAKYRGKFLRKEFRDYYETLTEEDKNNLYNRLKYRYVLKNKTEVLGYLEDLKHKLQAGELDEEFDAIDKIGEEDK